MANKAKVNVCQLMAEQQAASQHAAALAMTRLLAPTVTALPRRYMARTRCNVVILLWAAALLAPVSGGWVNLTVSTSEAVL